MGVNLSIKDVPDHVAERLRRRAARNHRSLQGELMSIVEQAARADESAAAGATTAAGDHSWTQGWKSIEQLIACLLYTSRCV